MEQIPHGVVAAARTVSLPYVTGSLECLQQDEGKGPQGDPEGVKPPLSYVALIVEAIESSPERRMTLSQIYKYIEARYSYYRNMESKRRQGWQNSIRHNLSLNDCFEKQARDDKASAEQRKGNYWFIRPGHENMFENKNYKRRRNRRPAEPLHSQSIGHFQSRTMEEIQSMIQYCMQYPSLGLGQGMIPQESMALPPSAPLGFPSHSLSMEMKEATGKTMLSMDAMDGSAALVPMPSSSFDYTPPSLSNLDHHLWQPQVSIADQSQCHFPMFDSSHLAYYDNSSAPS